MEQVESIIGKNIISSNVGIGEIVGITTLQDDGEEFYKVSFPKNKCINYFSVKNNTGYRVLATPKVINKAIIQFKTSFDHIEYATTQEKINMQKQMLKEVNVVKLAKSLSILNSEKTLHAQLSKPFNDSLSSFIDEIAFVLGVKHADAYLMLDLKVPAKKKA
ncbi:hypothetical protein [Bacteriovorax sp. Seq25_V]|uniref:hypothetical protein n=1 Tax=Bacteriovorax sp. Seq25_V TaxID=1201288 RepID=UPI00038A47E2|nr:hypothetical protein [Bacteriovorax sp. Seq25_V]EQC47608.1 hypothetical protein M900_0907 [Bacteriovorax sp. Seq25_V]